MRRRKYPCIERRCTFACMRRIPDGGGRFAGGVLLRFGKIFIFLSREYVEIGGGCCRWPIPGTHRAARPRTPVAGAATFPRTARLPPLDPVSATRARPNRRTRRSEPPARLRRSKAR